MAGNVSDAEALVKVLIENTEFDRVGPPIPWRKVDAPKKVGLLMEFSQMEVGPANKRAPRMAAAALEKHGIEIVPLNLDEFYEDILLLYFASFHKDGVVNTTYQRGSPVKEPLISQAKGFAWMHRLPHFYARTWPTGLVMTDPQSLSRIWSKAGR